MTDPKGEMRFNRRRALGLIAVTATGGTFLAADMFRAARPAGASQALITGAGVCTIMPQATEGPFYFDPKLDRRDIAEGRAGVPLEVWIQVVDPGCRPIPSARVDIWHCDADGRYSGYPRQPGGVDTSGETFLRGNRIADGDGIAVFSTIYPGWYPGRTPHIHFKAFPGAGQVLTGQMFFSDEISREIYAMTAPYVSRDSSRATFNDRDRIARRAGPVAMADLTRGETLKAALVVAVAA